MGGESTMKLMEIIAGSIVLGLLVAAHVKPDHERAMHRHFRKLERAGMDRHESYGAGI